LQSAETVLGVLREKSGQPEWAAVMATKRRKTLMVCAACHDVIHTHPVTNAA
jgi:hypothetical protein